MTHRTVGDTSYFHFATLSAIVLMFSISSPVMAQDTGACCDWSTGTCTDGSLEEDCPAPNYWGGGRTCEFTPCAESAYIRIIPVLPEAPNAQPYPAGTFINVNVNTIFIPQVPVRVWFNLQYGDWAPFGQLRAVAIKIDSETFSNTVGTPLTLPVEQCTQDSDCDSVMGPFSQCALAKTLPNVTGENTCRAGYIDYNHPDYFPFWFVQSVRTSTPDFDYGFSAFKQLLFDSGVPQYGGTLVLDLRSGAKGRYIINILPDPWSVLITIAFGHIPFTVQPAIIEIPVPCCNPEGACSQEYPSACESLGGTQVDQCAGDCNLNTIVDACEIANGTATDCDNNTIPDECDIAENPNVLDCNSNDILDSCEIDQDFALDCNNNNILDSCEMNNASDCNQTNTLDVCDIASGDSLDLDGNCVPDECDPMAAPLAEPNGVRKNRYISFVPANAGCNTAIRVKLTSLYHPDPPPGDLPDFSSSEGEFRWVGPTSTYPEGSNLSGNIFTGATLQCDPYFTDWSLTGLLHAFGSEILPDSIYEVQMVDDICLDLNDPLCYTGVLEIHTGRWGDIIEPFSHNSIASQPAISDILSIVDKFLGFLHPLKTSAQLQPEVPTPTFAVGIADVLKGVDAWLGAGYPYSGPEPCLP